MIISIEGPDFVGKNTLVKHLLEMSPEYVSNYNISILQFPNTDTEIGRKCRQMLESTEWSYSTGVVFQLLNTAHRYEYYEQLKEAKSDSSILLFIIRYNLSGPVYASLDGLDATKTWNLYAWFDDVLPDLTFIIQRDFNFDDLTNERAPDHYEFEDKQSKIRKIYQMADTLWGNRLGQVEHINNVNPKDTVELLLKKLKEHLS